MAYESELWEVMGNATGVAYDYRPEARPTVFDETECAELASTEFWSG